MKRKSYTGNFKEGTFSGYGSMKYRNGTTLKAKWNQGKPIDHGVHCFANKRMTRATFDGDEIFLEDRLTFPDNDFRIEYRGKFNDQGVMHGSGTLITRSEKAFAGEWVDDECDEHKE